MIPSQPCAVSLLPRAPMVLPVMISVIERQIAKDPQGSGGPKNHYGAGAFSHPMSDAQSSQSPKAPVRDQPGENTALLIIDMINCFDFAGGDALRRNATEAADAILDLREQAERAGLPVIYVNDNFGEWHSEKSRLVERARSRLAHEELAPNADDYFIIKPQFSGFYATPLPVLLPKLGVTRLILTGVATDICVLFTAADAHMRDYALWVPEDAVAAETPQRGRAALAIMRDHMRAETASTRDLPVAAWAKPVGV
jgi:nicotinamidase-related amidase